MNNLGSSTDKTLSKNSMDEIFALLGPAGKEFIADDVYRKRDVPSNYSYIRKYRWIGWYVSHQIRCQNENEMYQLIKLKKKK